MDALQTEVRDAIVDALMLHETVPDHLTAQDNIFDTMGLDSVDALEIVMTLKRRFGVEFAADDDATKEALKTIGSIASYVQANKPAPKEDPSAALFGQIQTAFVELFELEPHRITAEARLVEDLGLDSVDALDMMSRLQDITGQRVPEAKVESVRTVQDVLNLCVELTRA